MAQIAQEPTLAVTNKQAQELVIWIFSRTAILLVLLVTISWENLISGIVGTIVDLVAVFFNSEYFGIGDFDT